MSLDVLFYRIPTTIVEAQDADRLMEIFRDDDPEEEFTAFDGSGHAFSNLLDYLEELQPRRVEPPEWVQEVQTLHLIGICIITAERAASLATLLAGPTWNSATALERYLSGGSVAEDFPAAVEVLVEALTGADSDHAVFIVFS